MKKYGIYVGRFNPLHAGHCTVIENVLKVHGIEKSLIIVGSSNTGFSLRHFFSYGERVQFIKKVFPDLKVVGLPDYRDDKEWLSALDDILNVAGIDPKDVTFWGGCQEDIRFFCDDGRDYHILNRFDGTSKKISATEVRDALIFDRSLDGLVHSAIISDLTKLFKEHWEKFKKM